MKGAMDQGAESLTDAEAFEGDHLAEAAMVLLADGAGALVGERAQRHAETCATCAASIAEHALTASELQAAFAVVGTEQRERWIADARGVGTSRRAVLAGRAGSTSREDSHATQRPAVSHEPVLAGISEPPPSPRRARGGALWIAGGLLVAALASAPSLSGLAKGLSELREAMLVVVAVSVQAEQALRLASGRMEGVRTAASWIAAALMVAVGTWIARRAPRTAMDGTKSPATGDALDEGVEGTR